MIVADFLAGQIKIVFHRKAAAMFCRPASLSSWFRWQVIHDGITSGIADHIQIGIFVHDTDKVLFGILGNHGIVNAQENRL